MIILMTNLNLVEKNCDWFRIKKGDSVILDFIESEKVANELAFQLNLEESK